MMSMKWLITMVLCVLVLQGAPAWAGDNDEAAMKRMRKKMKTIVIPKIQFADVPVSTVIEYLKIKSRQLDPEGAGVNFVVILKPQDGNKKPAKKGEPEEMGFSSSSGEPLITMDMDNLPLSEAVRLVCLQAGLTHVVESHAVVVMSKNVTREKMELRIFPVDPRLMRDVKDVKKFFEEKGVTFPESH